MTSPVSNPYEWAPIQRFIAFAYAEGRWDAAKANRFVAPVVESSRFADAALAAGLELGQFDALYERMAREDATETTRKAA